MSKVAKKGKKEVKKTEVVEVQDHSENKAAHEVKP